MSISRRELLVAGIGVASAAIEACLPVPHLPDNNLSPTPGAIATTLPIEILNMTTRLEIAIGDRNIGEYLTSYYISEVNGITSAGSNFLEDKSLYKVVDNAVSGPLIAVRFLCSRPELCQVSTTAGNFRFSPRPMQELDIRSSQRWMNFDGIVRVFSLQQGTPMIVEDKYLESPSHRNTVSFTKRPLGEGFNASIDSVIMIYPWIVVNNEARPLRGRLSIELLSDNPRGGPFAVLEEIYPLLIRAE